MNKFRNCDLKIYFDNDLHAAIGKLAGSAAVRRHDYRPKREFRIAFLLVGFSDLGGASVPHRFMIRDYAKGGLVVKNYVLVSNFFRRVTSETEQQAYLERSQNVVEVCLAPAELDHVARGIFIRDWLTRNEIDFVVADGDPSILFALATRPCPLQALLNQDCYTFALGPGAPWFDVTFLVMLEQIFSYAPRLQDGADRLKVVMLPLHPKVLR